MIETNTKGKAGADVLHKVYSPQGRPSGLIIWETKNTQTWSNGWLEKLRQDQRREKADFAVLVSKTLPKDVRNFGFVEGIWITEFPYSLGLGTALRMHLIQVYALKQSSEGKFEKMEILHKYLTSTEFKHHIEAIVESFRFMQEDLNKERNSMQKLWARREKQIQLVVQNISGMYGEMQGIVGPSLPKIKRLELPSIDEI